MIKIYKEKKIIKISFFTFIIYLLLILLLEGILYTLIGIGLLSFLGFQYESYLSAFIFFASCYILMIPVNYYTSLLLSLFKLKGNITKFQERCIDFILYMLFASLVVGVVDYILPSVDISPSNQVLFVLLCYSLEICSEYFLYTKK